LLSRQSKTRPNGAGQYPPPVAPRPPAWGGEGGGKRGGGDWKDEIIGCLGALEEEVKSSVWRQFSEVHFPY